jgi:hypothetical protein
VIGALVWIGAAIGGVWLLERMRKRRDEVTTRRRRH